MDNTHPKQQAVTREEYLVANNYGKEELFFQLLAERDEALKLNAELMRWKKAYRELSCWYGEEDVGRTPEQIDAEARRIVEGK